MRNIQIVASIAVLQLGCASSHGTAPDDMSVAHHEQAAGQEQAVAQQHADQYDPSQQQSPFPACNADGPCWTSVTNPTEQHRKDAESHREYAAKHRAAAQALRDAESQSCGDLAERDRDTSPFYHREDIASVSKIDRQVPRGKAQIEVIRGARAVFRAVPGLTSEWLQRLVNCHRARAAAVGYDMKGMEYCPLALKGVTAVVSSTGDGFAVDVTSDDPAVAAEAWRRVSALKPAL